MPRKKDHLSRSERNGEEGRKKSHDKHAGRLYSEVAGRARDRGSGVDDKPAYAGLLVVHVSRRAPDLDQATMASDRSKGRKALDTVKTRSKKPAHGAGDPDSSDGSSDTGTASSDTETTSSDTGTASSISSIPLPEPYDGRPDQMVFDAWTSSVSTWVKYSKLPHKLVMSMFPRFVSGRAASYFMTYFHPSRRIRMLPIKPSLEEIFRAIHKDCFPLDHKMTLHRELMSASQGNHGVRIFALDLRRRARHIPYVSEQCLAAIFLAGVHKYIRIQLIRDGVEPGDTDLDTLLERASRYEYARTMLRAYERPA